ncbi:uncharacterized protein LOC112588927 isoform X2 [Harpegnathos saltator]|uniref:uncharacterized protein LOC112588927 isoform X2 n=1 Tax=Harpegnathos saltator TaxID=610380 RepID=UPI000DBECF01|nr:uncharacterized protein LOC112588927 isoform X2 [Harpegnathos saltator]
MPLYTAICSLYLMLNDSSDPVPFNEMSIAQNGHAFNQENDMGVVYTDRLSGFKERRIHPVPSPVPSPTIREHRTIRVYFSVQESPSMPQRPFRDLVKQYVRRSRRHKS